jgi:hypothetical protein
LKSVFDLRLPVSWRLLLADKAVRFDGIPDEKKSFSSIRAVPEVRSGPIFRQIASPPGRGLPQILWKVDMIKEFGIVPLCVPMGVGQ